MNQIHNTVGGKKCKQSIANVLNIHNGSISGIENVCCHNTVVVNCPQVTVTDIDEKTLMIIDQHPKMQKLVLHTGSTDRSSRLLEILKQNRSCLLHKWERLTTPIFISGPLKTGNDKKFTRIWMLHQFLKNTCADRSMRFIKNFKIFCGAKHLHTHKCYPKKCEPRLLNLDYASLICFQGGTADVSADRPSPRLGGSFIQSEVCTLQ